MRVTIIPQDRTVTVDGVGLEVDLQVDGSIHAIQWDGNSGWIEFLGSNTPTRPIEGNLDYDEYVAPLVALWQVEKDNLDEMLRTGGMSELEQQKVKIMMELDAVDRAKVRPLSAVVSGIATEADYAKLQNLNAKAEGLRAELQGIEATH